MIAYDTAGMELKLTEVKGLTYVNLGAGKLPQATAYLLRALYAGHLLQHGEEWLFYVEPQATMPTAEETLACYTELVAQALATAWPRR
jgi:hypothetical protein